MLSSFGLTKLSSLRWNSLFSLITVLSGVAQSTYSQLKLVLTTHINLLRFTATQKSITQTLIFKAMCVWTFCAQTGSQCWTCTILSRVFFSCSLNPIQMIPSTSKLLLRWLMILRHSKPMLKKLWKEDLLEENTSLSSFENALK